MNRDFISIASGGDGGSVQFCRCYSLNLPVAINDDLPFPMKGMLASRHRKQLSSSLIKEPILRECQCNPNTASTKCSRFIRCVCSEAVATDADILLESLDATLFPGVSSSIEVHSGFANEQAK
jgi:hypothetical protein